MDNLLKSMININEGIPKTKTRLNKTNEFVKIKQMKGTEPSANNPGVEDDDLTVYSKQASSSISTKSKKSTTENDMGVNVGGLGTIPITKPNSFKVTLKDGTPKPPNKKRRKKRSNTKESTDAGDIPSKSTTTSRVSTTIKPRSKSKGKKRLKKQQVPWSSQNK